MEYCNLPAWAFRWTDGDPIVGGLHSNQVRIGAQLIFTMSYSGLLKPNENALPEEPSFGASAVGGLVSTIKLVSNIETLKF